MEVSVFYDINKYQKIFWPLIITTLSNSVLLYKTEIKHLFLILCSLNLCSLRNLNKTHT